ncbi:MAG: pilus assembly protein N-terminal domain-containing protein [Rhodocyclaceae bacterium]|nr:pilus assembly protein N-terminal domain-containing protein [Rhodocyclaceae bacterium]
MNAFPSSPAFPIPRPAAAPRGRHRATAAVCFGLCLPGLAVSPTWAQDQNRGLNKELVDALRAVNAANSSADRGAGGGAFAAPAPGATAPSAPRSPGFRTVPALTPYGGTASVDPIGSAELQSRAARATVLQEIPQTLTLYVGQMVLIKAANVTRVAVGSGKVLEARVVDPSSLLLTAQDGGESTLHIWNKSGRISRVQVRVNTTNLDRVADELGRLTAGITGVSIMRVGEKIVLDGTNLDPGAVERLNQIAKLYGPSVVSLATADRIRVDRMVDIQVRIVEFTRNALDDLGMRWQTSGDGFNFGLFSDIASNSSYRIIPETSPFYRGAQNNASGDLGTSELLSRTRRTPRYYFGLSTALTSQINLQVQRGNALVLASPNLSTRSGGEAKFLAGGEIPLPAMSALGTGSVDFKPYGIRLEIKPVADGAGNISGTVLTEVSSIDPSVAVQGIPGLLTRRSENEFNIHEGDTIVLAGLMNRESSRTSDGLPGLRKVPLVGRAFRADTDTDKTQEVVVFLTPRVVTAADSRPRIERAREIEDNVSRGFGDLTEDRSKPPESASPPARQGTTRTVPAGQYEAP